MPPGLRYGSRMAPGEGDGTPRLVILGSGFAGFSLLRNLPAGAFDVTVVSPRNYFLFTPLLPSAASGTVEFRSILEPIRKRCRTARLLEAEADGVDWTARRVRCHSVVSEESFELAYDRLVIAVGAAVADYGIPGVRRWALPLRDVEDGRAVRSAVVRQFSAAEMPGLSAPEVGRRVRVVVIGGGPTGVEIAAEIQDLIHGELTDAFPRVAPLARVVIVEATERLLGGFDEALSSYTRRHFLREGIEVRTGVAVARIEEHEIFFKDDRTLPFGLAIWAGGNAPRALIETLDLELEKGRIVVDGQLRIAGRDGAYAAGDCATIADAAMPATAQVAQQQGKYLARTLRQEADAKPFRFRSLGMLAYIGGGEALADLPAVQWSGRGAWIFWRSVYLTKLVGFANKVKVLFDWAKAKVFGRDLSRF